MSIEVVALLMLGIAWSLIVVSRLKKLENEIEESKKDFMSYQLVTSKLLESHANQFELISNLKQICDYNSDAIKNQTDSFVDLLKVLRLQNLSVKKVAE